jgi:serine/threonine-protein kinase
MNLNELAGQTVGAYRLTARLGGGNFGTVYRAQEMMGDACIREVAIKLYDPEATRLGRVEGMLQDCALPAKILASNAPIEQKRHFAQIYAFGHLPTPVGDCAFVAMELIQNGEPFDSVIRRFRRLGRYPGEEAISGYMRQFFTALALAHREGVLHRDIKPANVMLADGVVRVLDFGMGAYLDRPETALKTTVSIYAPENFDGPYTALSDIYEAGLLFYELYTGWQPFEGGESGGMDKEREKRLLFRFRPGRSFPGAQPSEKLDAIFARCLEYTPNARFQSALEVLEALSEADVFQTMQEALRSGRYDYALALSEKALAASPPAERRVFCLKTRADALTALGRNSEALDALKAAIEIAEQTGAFVRTPSDWNALIDAICLVYTKMGQAGMARIFARKKR